MGQECESLQGTRSLDLVIGPYRDGVHPDGFQVDKNSLQSKHL